MSDFPRENGRTTDPTPVRRRDKRFRFVGSSAAIELPQDSGVPLRGRLLDLSVAGLAFEMEAGLVELKQAMLRPAVVRVGQCDLPGTILIKNVRTHSEGRVFVGALFYPESPEVEYALMALLSGLSKPEGESRKLESVPKPQEHGPGHQRLAVYIRCSRCHGAVWMPDASRHNTATEHTCENCGAGYRIEILRSFEKTRDRLGRAAREFGQEEGIDLPGAYSVLLGVMSLEQLVEIAEAKLSSSSQGSPGLFDYDPEYKGAVAEGLLTARQALERGSRKAQILRLEQRHDLPRDLAELVADNRLSLLAAVRKREMRKTTHDKITVRWEDRPRPRPFLAAAVAILATLAVGGYGLRLWLAQVDMAHQADRAEAVAIAAERLVERSNPEETTLPVPEVGAAPAGTSITTDQNRQPLEIRGPTPKAVLLAYCSAGEDANFVEPVELASAEPNQRGLRFGILRDWRDGTRTHAIQIRQDHRTRRWFAGDGAHPIPRLEPIRLTLGASRIPVYDGRSATASR